MKYLTVLGSRTLGTNFTLYHLNPASIIFIMNIGTRTVSMTSNTVIDSPICKISLPCGYLYVSGVAEELIARMS